MTFLLLPMSKREINRYEIIKRLLRKEINSSEAARLLQLTTRHVRRLKNRVRQLGAAGLIHRARGKKGNRALPDTERAKIICLLRERYIGFKPTFAGEQLAARHQIHRDPKTIRQIMIDEKLWKPKSRHAQITHRQWRERKAHYGEMEQFDGSYEHWFEDRAPKCCLLAAVDDATGTITRAQFVADEGVLPVFAFWKEYVQEQGKPHSIYLDKLSTYKLSDDLAKENHDALSQFERAMMDLGIKPISANSPQAKGRIERLFGTLQDRLIKELRLANICTIASANRFLANDFIPRFNKRFGVAPCSAANLHTPLSARERANLDSTFSRHIPRTVRNDFTVSYQKQWYQLTNQQPVTVCKKDRIIVEEQLSGEIKIRHKGRYLAYELIPKGAPKRPAPSWVLAAVAPRPTPPRLPVRPAPDHPWRQFTFGHKEHLTTTATLAN